MFRSWVRTPLSPPNIMDLTTEEKFLIFHSVLELFQKDNETLNELKNDARVNPKDLVKIEEEVELLYNLMVRFGKEVNVIT